MWGVIVASSAPTVSVIRPNRVPRKRAPATALDDVRRARVCPLFGRERAVGDHPLGEHGRHHSGLARPSHGGRRLPRAQKLRCASRSGHSITGQICDSTSTPLSASSRISWRRSTHWGLRRSGNMISAPATTASQPESRTIARRSGNSSWMQARCGNGRAVQLARSHFPDNSSLSVHHPSAPIALTSSPQPALRS